MGYEKKTRVKDTSKIIVIGASAGGTRAIIDVVQNLPEDLDAAVCIVQHIPAHISSRLATVLANKCPLRVVDAQDGETVEPGTVYTAIADHHLLVENDRIVVKKGPRENRFRPSIDALFRSVAYHYRERCMGVVLSGALDDGTSGMWAIKRFGGISIIQSRDEAIFNSMPSNVHQHVDVDHEVLASKIGPLLAKLCTKPVAMDTEEPKSPAEVDAFMRAEINIAQGQNALKNGVMDHGKYSPLTCPDCHGALTEYKEGKIRRYRCHTGHGFTSESLLSGISESIEKSMWEVMRGLEEGQLLLNHLAEISVSTGSEDVAEGYKQQAGQLAQSAQVIKEVILSN